jgi:N-acetylneuraminate synthase
MNQTSTTDRTFVIAEAGVNHDGDLARALELVDVAARAGADAVKFQTFKAESLVTAGAAKAAYQVANSGADGGQLAMLRALELGEDDHRSLVARCADRGIRFMSTAFDAASLRYLAGLGMPAIKLPSGDITCAPLLLQAARLHQPLIVSTGMSTLADIEAALGVIAFGLTEDRQPRGRVDFEAAYASEAGRRALAAHVTLLHCVTEYPAPPEAVNLRAMDTMAACFGLPVGYSDHTLGIAVALAAVARGATVIEKHFTLDRRLPGPDHAASLEPDELSQMIAGIRTIERALGSPRKGPAAVEIANRDVARRSLVAARPLRAGDVLDEDALACKRPGTGISPIHYYDALGRRAGAAVDVDMPVGPWT